MKPTEVYKEGQDYYLVLEVEDTFIRAVRVGVFDTFTVSKDWARQYWRRTDDGEDRRVDGEQGPRHS